MTFHRHRQSRPTTPASGLLGASTPLVAFGPRQVCLDITGRWISDLGMSCLSQAALSLTTTRASVASATETARTLQRLFPDNTLMMGGRLAGVNA